MSVIRKMQAIEFYQNWKDEFSTEDISKLNRALCEIESNIEITVNQTADGYTLIFLKKEE